MSSINELSSGPTLRLNVQSASGNENKDTPTPTHYPKILVLLQFTHGPFQLSQVLGFRRSESPIIIPASIIGYSYKLWGTYPAIVEGPPENVMRGVAYEVQPESEITTARLVYYQTDVLYTVHACLLYTLHP